MSWPVPPHGFLGSQASTAATDNDTYQISRSLRFNSADSAYLNRTPSVEGNRKIWTWSGWMKRASISGDQIIFSAGVSDTARTLIYFDGTSSTFFFINNTGSGYFGRYLNAAFRDTSSWYHIIVSVDTNQATSSNRIKFYINGALQASTAAGGGDMPDVSTFVNNTNAHAIGRNPYDSTGHVNGYLTEINFIDGQALTPSSFGETDATTGRWKAKAFSGNYGTNGFYLKFADNSSTAALGTDSSGNGNTWTTNNLSVTPGAGNDSLTDSPSNYGAISTTLVNDTYQISKSLRFNSADSAYVSKTYASGTAATTLTISCWIKRSSLSTTSSIFASRSGNTVVQLEFASDDKLSFVGTNSAGSITMNIKTSDIFRDVAAWYHLVLLVDTTQATASDRVKIYVNGSQITSFTTSTYPAQNSTYAIFGATEHSLGGRLLVGSGVDAYFSGYLTEIIGIDGQALTPSSFGTRDINTYLWKPKAYTGTYGTNGFYLNFSDSSGTTSTTLGKDQAGSNNWTPSGTPGFSVSAGPGNDSLVDSPTYYGTDTGVGGEARGDYATLNPLVSAHTYSNGNLDVVLSTTGVTSIPSTVSTLGVSSGKWYFEFTPTALNTGCLIGITATPASNVYPGGNSSSYGYYSADGNKFNSASGTAYGNSFTVNDIIGIAFDIDGGKIWFAKNGTWQASGNPASGTNAAFTSIASGTYFSSMHKDTAGAANASGTFNFGQRPFIHAAPSGFRALRDYNKLPTPTGGEVRGNYCTLNPLAVPYTGTISNGNLEYSKTNTGIPSARGSIYVKTGKWYCEVKLTATSDVIGVTIGIMSPSSTGYVGFSANSYAYRGSGSKFNNDTSTSYGASYSVGDVIGVALDMDAGTLTFYKNGVSQGLAFSSLSGEFTIGAGWYGTAGTAYFEANFGQRSWAYDAPFGFMPLCTTLLPQPIIQKPSSYMDVLTYTGNGGTQTISGLNFSPDLVWLKSRSSASWWHILVDSVRGAGRTLSSNATNAELGSGSDIVSSLNSNGFSLNVSPNETSNENGTTYVAWAWDKSPIAGMDVVSFASPSGTTQSTVAHNLGVAPKMIITKNRDTSANNWAVFHSSVCDTTSKFLQLNTTAALQTFATVWGASLPTSSVFGVTGGGVAASGVNCIAYCFAEIEGFSKFGSYIGNANSDGPFVYCGFRPKWILIKNSSAAGTNWVIWDSVRRTFNVIGEYLVANTSGAEASIVAVDILSNGFKIRDPNTFDNGNGNTIIFAAFSEAPFKYARAR